MSTVVLIRPGCTNYDDQSRLLGTLEMPLNDAGMEQVEDIIRHLQQENVRLEAIYTAPADPACSTARAIAESQHGVKVKELDALRNVDQGLWQGLPEADVRKRYPQFFRNGREKPQTICPPEGETLGDACERIQKVLNKAVRKYQVLAVVVPDPIASVIRCALEARGLAVAACLSGEKKCQRVEFFTTEGFDATPFVNWEYREPAKVAAEPATQHPVK
ncbi:MAG: histidine phosphatase family protein [Planctomycetaceae bacterium]